MHHQNRNTWASSICWMLYRYGFDHVWDNHGVGDKKVFLALFRERLIANFHIEWNHRINNSKRYTFYASLKSSCSVSVYLSEVKHIKARALMARMRLGVSQIRTHKLRFVPGIEENDLICPLCRSGTETEIHFMFVCPIFKDLREQYIARKYYNQPASFKLTLLFASENRHVLLKVAKYLSKAFELRTTILSERVEK